MAKKMKGTLGVVIALYGAIVGGIGAAQQNHAPQGGYSQAATEAQLASDLAERKTKEAGASVTKSDAQQQGKHNEARIAHQDAATAHRKAASLASTVGAHEHNYEAEKHEELRDAHRHASRD